MHAGSPTAAARRAGGGSLPCRAFGQHRGRRGPPPLAAGDPWHRGRKADPLYRIRRQLLVAHERLSERAGLASRPAWTSATRPAKSAPPTSPRNSSERSTPRLPSDELAGGSSASTPSRTADVVELRRLATTVRRWEPEILGWHRTGLSNGPTEVIDLLIKKIKRVGHGFRNFENHRLRLLLHCGAPWPRLLHRPAVGGARVRTRMSS
jgi:transposase